MAHCEVATLIPATADQVGVVLAVFEGVAEAGSRIAVVAIAIIVVGVPLVVRVLGGLERSQQPAVIRRARAVVAVAA